MVQAIETDMSFNWPPRRVAFKYLSSCSSHLPLHILSTCLHSPAYQPTHTHAMSSSIRNARAANRRQRAREQDEDSSGSEVEESQRSQAKRKKGKQRARDDDEEDDDDEPVSTQRRGPTQTQGATQGLTVDSIGSAVSRSTAVLCTLPYTASHPRLLRKRYMISSSSPYTTSIENNRYGKTTSTRKVRPTSTR
jgi:hypothetical protein